MRIAYLILAHTNIPQLATLIELLTRDGHACCFVHLDKRLYHRRHAAYLRKHCRPGSYHLLPGPNVINWGGFSIVLASLRLIDQCLNYRHEKFAYLSLISGMDLPLKSTEQFVAYLGKHQHPAYMETFTLPDSSRWGGSGGLDRLHYYWFTDELSRPEVHSLVASQKQAGARRNMPASLHQMYGGSQWWTMSHASAEYMIEYVNNHPEVVRFFKHSYVPDEIFFNTILHNSPFSAAIYQGNLRHIDWSAGGSSPKTFTSADFDMLIAQDAWFARKFDMLVDADIIERVKAHVAQ
ncbi:beta-1,6-N-acetylglucosaminyltransferase [Chitinophaga horti]|uniref:Peptide O-xylosyltransferase n=1 Tax=Chitinophaga horti TaxID=2920382 RepID=A0ABY6JBS0_9BACT|nr:beta-1,6-N-acetylglucosaminyltransferase [Chitinophaga horti]UYQ95741.1 beta-1,6-N-acetylglucosaminyltransferase [Chitinophaga horti]